MAREAPDGPLVPSKGDRIAIVGNTFAERMAHFGHLEALLQSAYPEHGLIVRNLGWSGDTPSLQPRPLDFGTMEEYLLQEQADVIIACFGMNESFSGEAGRPAFEESLRDFIISMRDLKPGGAEPEIILVSPIAHEDIGGNFPDGTSHNVDLAAYTESMRQVAAEQGVRFVDLHEPSMKLWDIPIGPHFTINGIHLTETGNSLISEQLFHSTFDPGLHDPPSKDSETDWERLEPLREAVIEKNRQYFYRYRPINSYYVMGGRKNPFGVVNFPAEMSKLDAMVAYRDERVHALAAGRDPGPIDDEGIGELVEIESNYAGPDIVFRDPSGTKAGFQVPEGYELHIFASEQDFPELANPVSLSFDEQGRLWVLAIPTYPQYLPGVEPEDKLLVFEDVDGDGEDAARLRAAASAQRTARAALTEAATCSAVRPWPHASGGTAASSESTAAPVAIRAPRGTGLPPASDSSVASVFRGGSASLRGRYTSRRRAGRPRPARTPSGLPLPLVRDHRRWLRAPRRRGGGRRASANRGRDRRSLHRGHQSRPRWRKLSNSPRSKLSGSSICSTLAPSRDRRSTTSCVWLRTSSSAFRKK